MANPWKITALALCALVEPKAIQILSRDFGNQGIVVQTAVVGTIMALLGIFFGLWFPKEIELVFNDFRTKGIRGLYKIGLLLPACALFLPLQSPLSNHHPAWLSYTAALAMSLIGTTCFWLVAIPLRWAITIGNDLMEGVQNATRDKPLG